MSHPCCGGPEEDAPRTAAASPGTAEVVALAASPTFLAMAVASTWAAADDAALLCQSGGPSWVGGMGVMYLLMSAFHAPAWLRWATER